MTYHQWKQALDMWRSGKDTHDIAKALDFPEAKIESMIFDKIIAKGRVLQFKQQRHARAHLEASL